MEGDSEMVVDLMNGKTTAKTPHILWHCVGKPRNWRMALLDLEYYTLAGQGMRVETVLQMRQ